jgi:hypothetical protein
MRTAKRLVIFLAILSIVGLGDGVAAAQTIPCRKQCRILGQVCRVPYKVAYQTQRAACSGEGRRLCIVAAKIMYAAGKTLCRSIVTNCRRSCQRNGSPGDSQCGDGIVAGTEQCDPPGWASCTDGAACGADCQCPSP